MHVNKFIYLTPCLDCSQVQVTVTATPNGFADAADGDYFMMPEERLMSMSEFVRCIESPTKDEVLYIQKQNSNLTDEFKSIIDDVESEIAWASSAFNKSPDAVNFWMGDERAITSSRIFIKDKTNNNLQPQC